MQPFEAATPSSSLRRAIADDLRPVQPLPRPARRVLLLLPLAPVMLLAAPLMAGVRPDAATLGFGLSWGLSIVQLLFGFLVLGAALSEAVPGRNVPQHALTGIVTGATAIVCAITLVTWIAGPVHRVGETFVYVWIVCFVCPVLTALPVIFAAAWLVRRAYPVRPRIAGVLYGLGAGLMSDAGWRLFCHFSLPAHVFATHAAAIAACALIGSAVAGGRAFARQLISFLE